MYAEDLTLAVTQVTGIWEFAAGVPVCVQLSEPSTMPICRRILDVSTGTAYYLTAAVRKEEEAEVLDLNLTDLQDSWSMTGHSRPAEGLTREHWMTFAREALLGENVAGAPPGERDLQWRITPGQPRPETLTVMWTFVADLGAGERRWKAEVIAHRASDPRPIADPMVHGLLTELHSAQVECQQNASANRGLASELNLAQTTLEQRLTARETAEEQLYVKFAALLNQGKALAAEYRERALAAEERLENLSLQGGLAAGSDASGNETPTAQSDIEKVTNSISGGSSGDGSGSNGGTSEHASQDATGAAAASVGEGPQLPQQPSPSAPAGNPERSQAGSYQLEAVEAPKKRVAAKRKKRLPPGGGRIADTGDFSQLK